METIKILFYTDKHDEVDQSKDFVFEPADPFRAPFGLSMLRDLLLKARSTVATIEITLVNRNIPSHGANKLTLDLLSPYDELWVFGYYQEKIKEITAVSGGPHNELDHTEVLALKKWMDEGGGVMITGDHANRKPGSVVGKPEVFYSLGRALGMEIPRAGKMRKWEGPPTLGKSLSPEHPDPTNFNTQDFGAGKSFDSGLFQSDNDPQSLTLAMFRHPYSDPIQNKILFCISPHDLFYIKPGKVVNVFPDHMHEGEVLAPDTTGPEWPDGSPKVEFVAWGQDKRLAKPDLIPLISVFDGHIKDVGRIVADSSFHHYTNINLRCLPRDPEGASEPRAALDLIGYYYHNLALWLARKSKQAALGLATLIRLAGHPQILEEADADVFTLGRTANYILEQESRPIETNEMMRLITPEAIWAQPELRSFVPRELVLGSVIDEILRRGEVSKLMEEEIRTSIVFDGYKQAVRFYKEALESHFSLANGMFNSLP